MASLTYYSGVGSSVTFTPDASGVLVSGMSNIDWDIKESARLAEVSNSQTGAHARRIACLNDTDGNFSIVWDSSLDPDSVGIEPGATGSLTANKGTSGRGKSQNIIIESIDTKVVIQGATAIMVVISYKGNGNITDF